ncbi:MAG TPA: pitrilysin family protein [Candidatus Solibacter sp.]|nr:pitrilysin family protein [Candidatus Solibacter sp.]
MRRCRFRHVFLGPVLLASAVTLLAQSITTPQQPVPDKAGRGAAPAGAPAATQGTPTVGTGAPASGEADKPGAEKAGQTPAAAAGAGRGGRGAPQPAGVLPKDLKFPPLHSIQPPTLAPITLPNGMKLVLLEDHELPMISGMALVRGGTLLDPPERIGLAAATGALLRSGGTVAKTPDQMDTLLETMAATIDSGTDESGTRVTFSTLKENAATVLGMFKEVLTQPEFRQDKIDGIRAQLRTAIASRNEDSAIVAQRSLVQLIYGKDNPYGWVPQYATVDRITRNDVWAFYRRYFYPKNTTVAVWGDFDTAQMKAAIEKEFGEWNVAAQADPALPKWMDNPSPGLYLAEKKDMQQTYFAAGELGGAANDSDLAALQVMAAILGGPKGRLSEKARSRTGTPHDIRAVWIPPLNRPGRFEISGTTRNIGTVDVIRTIREELERIRTEVSEDEVRSARESLINGLIFSFDTRAKLISRQLILDFHGYPKDYLRRYEKALQEVTRPDVLRVAKQYVDPAKLTVVLVGNPQSFSGSLEKLGGQVNTLDLTIPESRVETIVTSDASLAEGKALLQKAQAAMGGVQKLLAIKDYTEEAAYAIDAAVPTIGGAKVKETDRWLAPTVFRQDSVLPAGQVAAYTDGRVGWIMTPQGWGGLTGTQLRQVQGDLFRSWFRLLLSDLVEGRTVNAVNGTSVQVTDPGGQECKIEFDAETGLPRRVSYDTAQAVGPPLYTEDILEDFRDVNGIRLPFKITINQSGKKFADVTVLEFKLNSGLKQTDLARRPM